MENLPNSNNTQIPNPISGFKGFVSKSLSDTGFLITVAWLVLLYISAIWLVLGTLSSIQFQQRLSNQTDNLTKQKFSVPILLRKAQNIEDNQLEEVLFQNQIRLFLSDNSNVNNKIDELRKERVNAIKGLKDLSEKLKNDFVEVKKIWSKMIIDLKNPSPIQSTEITDNQEGLKLTKEHEDSLSKLDELTIKLDKAEKVIVEKEQGSKEIMSSLSDKNLEYMKFKASEKEDIEDNTLRDFLIELDFLRKFKFDVLATMPTQLLTLLLTLSMGALGSIIYLTRELFDENERKSLTWYIFRPLLGMVTAIAMFVLVKSGQLVMADSTGMSSETLNPFFISFLGIISGVLSEQAYEKINNTGRSFFKSDKPDASSRWAFRLKDEMEKQKKSIEDLMVFVEQESEVLGEWLSEKKTVPEKEQQIIAAWLRKPVRDLFSDLPPNKK